MNLNDPVLTTLLALMCFLLPLALLGKLFEGLFNRNREKWLEEQRRELEEEIEAERREMAN